MYYMAMFDDLKWGFRIDTPDPGLRGNGRHIHAQEVFSMHSDAGANSKFRAPSMLTMSIYLTFFHYS